MQTLEMLLLPELEQVRLVERARRERHGRLMQEARKVTASQFEPTGRRGRGPRLPWIRTRTA